MIYRFALAIVAVLFAARAEAGGCSSCVQAQAVYAAPVVQQFAFVPQVQAVQVQAYAAPVVVQQQVVRQRVVAAYAAQVQAVAVQPVVVKQQRARRLRSRSVIVQRSRVRGAAAVQAVAVPY